MSENGSIQLNSLNETVLKVYTYLLQSGNKEICDAMRSRPSYCLVHSDLAAEYFEGVEVCRRYFEHGDASKLIQELGELGFQDEVEELSKCMKDSA